MLQLRMSSLLPSSQPLLSSLLSSQLLLSNQLLLHQQK